MNCRNFSPEADEIWRDPVRRFFWGDFLWARGPPWGFLGSFAFFPKRKTCLNFRSRNFNKVTAPRILRYEPQGPNFFECNVLLESHRGHLSGIWKSH